MARGGTGSNLPVPTTIYATPTRRAGGGGQWLTGLLPWWGWVGLAIAFVATTGVAAIVAFFQTIVSEGGSLLGLGAVALVVFGLAWAILGFFLRMVPHGEVFSRGHHMVRNGLLGGVFGLAIMFGGLNVAWGVGSLVVHDVMTGVRARVALPDAPPALQVQFPTLAGAAAPAPSPR